MRGIVADLTVRAVKYKRTRLHNLPSPAPRGVSALCTMSNKIVVSWTLFSRSVQLVTLEDWSYLSL